MVLLAERRSAVFRTMAFMLGWSFTKPVKVCNISIRGQFKIMDSLILRQLIASRSHLHGVSVLVTELL